VVAGVCTDSRGLEIAEARGVPLEIISCARHMKAIGCDASADMDMSSDASSPQSNLVKTPLEYVRESMSVFSESVVTVSESGSLPASWHFVVYALVNGSQVYIGQTKEFSNRITQHRQSGRCRNGTTVIVGKVNDRVGAEMIETLLIQHLQESPHLVSLESLTDGRRSLISS
jgi:hypothetical protein